MKIKIEGIKPHEIYSGEKIIELLRDAGIEVAPEVRKYDWGKTLSDVLVHYDNFTTCQPYMTPGAKAVWQGWQPNIRGKCPVDPEASILKIRFHDKSEWEGLAQNWDWALKQLSNDIVAYKFIRLAEGFEW